MLKYSLFWEDGLFIDEEILISHDRPVNKFPGGELNIKHESSGNKYNIHHITIKSIIRNSDDVMSLLLLTDALRRHYAVPIALELPYVPYARQDRVCNEGESLAIKVFADLINTQNYTSVTIADPHSDVTPALINNCRIIPVEDIINHFLLEKIKKDKLVLISPDAGSLKKIGKITQKLRIKGLEVFKAFKNRNTLTGDIDSTDIFCNNLQGRDVLIIDDICDGGRTFLELAKKIKKKNGGKIYLYVTHGIFSNGLSVFKDVIDHVYTTDAYCALESNIWKEMLTTFKLEEMTNVQN